MITKWRITAVTSIPAREDSLFRRAGGMHFSYWKRIFHFALNSLWEQIFTSNRFCYGVLYCEVLLCNEIKLWQEAIPAPATSEAKVQILREILEGWNKHCPQIMYKILRQAHCLLSSPIYPMTQCKTRCTTKEKRKHNTKYMIQSSNYIKITLYICICMCVHILPKTQHWNDQFK